ncbi:unnamed protein product [Pleuronectes platessa]|uniref:Uncharacterized protein n=1 Tax=Pleuronectes platessa TaxID=8262 RepID=A0A9N7Z8W7_PLEPL|nr:unnamed protein product [Pleuronectes platessa]
MDTIFPDLVSCSDSKQVPSEPHPVSVRQEVCRAGSMRCPKSRSEFLVKGKGAVLYDYLGVPLLFPTHKERSTGCLHLLGPTESPWVEKQSACYESINGSPSWSFPLVIECRRDATVRCVRPCA